MGNPGKKVEVGKSHATKNLPKEGRKDAAGEKTPMPLGGHQIGKKVKGFGIQIEKNPHQEGR